MAEFNYSDGIFPLFGVRQRACSVGDEKITSNGLMKVYTQDGTWKWKHHLIWEKHNGPVPKGYRVIFLSGNKFNFELNNLALATRNEIQLLNHYGMQFNDNARTRTGLVIIKHRALIGKLIKKNHNTYNIPKLYRGCR
jgi:hypothetical protein